MKVELKDAKVELEVKNGKTVLHINGHTVDLPRVAGIKLVFGEEESVRHVLPPKPVVSKVAAKGCQTPAARKKLSESLKKYHADKKLESKQKKPSLIQPATKKLKKVSHLNGASAHS